MSTNIEENSSSSSSSVAALNTKGKNEHENGKRNVVMDDDEASSSSNEKLKIDVSDNEIKQQQNGKSKEEATHSNSSNAKTAKADESIEVDEESNNSKNADNKKTPTSTTGSKKRRVDKGLDGGYWSRMSLDNAASNTSVSSSPQSSRKRRRTATERLDLSAYKLPHHLSSSSLFVDVDSSAESETAHGNETSDGEMNTSIHSESTVGSRSASAASSHAAKDRFTLFKTKSFLAVLNDEGGFYLCQATHAIYEDSKKCKIQWLEEAGENLYKMGYVDWVDPATIVARVKVRRRKEDHLLQIDAADLEKVNDLVEKALKEGGITVDFDKEGKDGKKKGASKSNKDMLNDEELYEKETPKSDQDNKGDDKKKEEKEKEEKSDKKQTTEKTISKPSEKQAEKSTKPTTESVKPKPQKPTEKTEKPLAEKEKEKKPSTEPSKIVKSNPNGEKLQKKAKIIESDDSEEERRKKKKPSTSEKPQQQQQQTKKVAPTKKPSNNDEDTDELESDSEKPQSKDPRTKPKQSPKQPGAQQTQTGQKAAPVEAQPAVVDGSLQVKKRRLDKAISNRHLQENTRVEVFAKDPFFEQDVEVPFVSPSAHSKLVFRAVYLNDMKLLKSLIDDVDRVLSVQIGRSVGVNETAAQYAVQLGNKRALEMLLDDFFKLDKKRVQMPDTMLYRFSNGTYNPRSMGGLPFMRKLTESRGAKEGNQALTKDHDLLEFCKAKESRYKMRSYFKKLFELAYESGCSTEMFDTIMAKFKANPDTSLIFDTRFIYELVYRAILYGHRHLAAHVISLNAAINGFNSVHIEVLKADSDQELKCQLRAQMCTKKPYANDYVTPIHCASINPNVKYLKTLLSITQDFNISDRRGRRPVHYAAVCEGPTPLEYLISRVSPYDLDSDGNTPLHLACQAGRWVNVEILLNNAQTKLEEDNALTTDSEIHNKYGLGGINKPNRRGKLPIHLAIAKNNYDCIKVLLKYGCNVEYPLPNSMDKITPLMYACQLGHAKLAKLLVENNAKVTARDRFWRTATMHAAMNGQTSILSYLLRLGADPNAADSSGNTSLHYACAYGWYHAVKTLIESGARVNAANDWKLTPFGAAFLKGHVGICDQLLQLHSNQIDVNFRTDDGETLVMLAVSSSNVLNEASVSQLDYIINKLGGNATLVDSRGNNAFHYLASNRLERQQLELAFPECDKAALDAKSAEQEQLRLRMADCLLKAKCSPTLANNDMETPLIRALTCLNVRFARYLLAMKANSGGKLEKSFLAVLADKCLDMDACAVILGDEYTSTDVLNKFKPDFERLAAQKDENGLTPFQQASLKLESYLSKKTNETVDEKAAATIPISLSRFILFLHLECKSNPNEPVYSNSKYSTSDNDEDIDNDASRSSTNSDKDESASSTGNKIKFLPVFKMISNRCVDLIASLVAQAKNSAAIPIDMNVYDNEGLTPLLQSIVSKEFKFAEKLIDLGLFDDSKLLKAQICKNSSTHLKESVLQLLIRSSQCELLLKTVRLMSNNTKHLIDLLEHQNSFGQNLLHTLSLCSSTNLFNSAFLNSLFKELYAVLTKDRATECLPNLLKTKDILGRNPVHFCLLTIAGNEAIRPNTDLELFFVEDLYAIVDSAKVEQIFTQRDSFDRLPIHYLFYNTFNRASDLELYKTALLKQSSQENGVETLLKSIKSVELKRDAITSIDPVELLSLIIKQTTTSTTNKSELIDKKDSFGYTPMHYAAIRGASVCLSLLISSSCDFMSRANDSNTPLSSAVYFKRQSCALTLLRLIETSSAISTTLSDFYNLPVPKEDDEEAEEHNLKWLGDKDEADVYKRSRIQLYELILSYDWEGLSWLVLENLAKYSLTRLDSIRSALASNKFSLALRLIHKLKRELVLTSPNKSPIEAYENLFKQSKAHSNRTLLHCISLIDFNSLNDKSSVMRILESLFETPTLNKPDHVFNVKYEAMLKEFLESRDELGSTALHYAFYNHNFTLIDFIHAFLETKQASTILPAFEDLMCKVKDSSGQSAYAITFWQVGRIAYSKKSKENIMRYTSKYLSTPGKLEAVSKARFPHVNIPNFKSEDSVCGRFIDDYPNTSATSAEFMISPLLYAIKRQSFDMCKFMIKSLGFDVNTSDANKISALVYTIRVNNLNLCKLLMNMDYEPDNERAKAAAPKQTTLAGAKSSRMKNLFTTLLPSNGEPVKTRPAKKADSDDSDSESESSDSDDDEAEQNGVEVTAIKSASSNQFKVKSNIVLNHLDDKSRTIFHHLACSLDYGSFRNVELARLLFGVFNSTEQQNSTKLPQLSEFLKRVDSKIKTASEYALKNGNIELYEEFKRQLIKGVTPQLSHTELETFTVNDTVYNPAAKVDYDKDSSAFLHSQQSTSTDAASADKDYFTVDSLSNMNKIGRLVWDKKYNVPYDVILTKTDVSYGLYGIHNFYKIQLIVHSYNNDDSTGENSKQQQICVLFTRWGRIGDQGQCQRTPFSSLSEAKDEFAKLFKQKTGNDFVDTVLEKKKPFESKPRRYSLVKLELRRRPKLKDIQFGLFDSTNPQSIFNQSIFAKLPQSEHFKQFWTDLLDVDYLKSRIHQSAIISADYIPLTQLSRESIEKAYSILNKSLKPLIERRMELEKLNIKENLMEHMNILEQINKHSNEFYELIPQMNYNYEKLKPIANEAELDAQICALNQLSNAQLACRILMGAKSALSTSMTSPFDYVYRAVGCRFELMRESDVETQYILKYCMPSEAAREYSIKRVFKFERPGEQERFDKLQLRNANNISKLKNRYLLWHGTSTENLLSIMCKGLRIAPSDALASGARFGKGIYFSDSFSFSHNYTRGRTNTRSGNRRRLQPQTTTTTRGGERRNYMLLCEVALGKAKELKDETFDTWPPEGFDSVKALGRVEPDPSQSVTLPNGCVVPLGQPLPARLEPGESYYTRSCNEPQYIVYNEAQCCIRYIVQYHSTN